MQNEKQARTIVNVEDINTKNSENVYKFISRGEEAYSDQISDIAEQIKLQNKKIVLITGPSSAGKTTSSFKICEELEKQNLNSFVINMDNFFKDLNTVPFLPNGERDMEGIVALDTVTIRKCLNDILTYGKTMLPQFDFKTHKRKADWVECNLNNNEIVILEGIHALNPEISLGLDVNKIYKIYVHCNTDFYYNNTPLLQARQLRLLRRLIRDERERHAPIEETLSLWKSVCEGEDKNIRPFKQNADYFLNSTLFYEPSLYKSILLDKFKQIKDNEQIDMLLEKLKLFSIVDESLVPQFSVVREFIGK